MTLPALLEKLEKAEKGSRGLDGWVYAAMGFDGLSLEEWAEVAADPEMIDPCPHGCPFYTTSIDAALTLVPSEWVVRLSMNLIPGPAVAYIESHELGGINIRGSAVARTPALALCRAGLEATAFLKARNQ